MTPTIKHAYHPAIGLLLAGCVGIASCGSDDESTAEPASTPAENPSIADADADTPESPSAETSDAATPDEAGSSTDEPQASESADAPDRIVVLDSGYLLDNLVAFGLGDAVVGRGDFGFGQDVTPSWLSDHIDVDDIEFIGSFPAYNFEQIAALEPDLIVGAAGAMDGSQELFEEIAPTIALQTSDDSLQMGRWEGVTMALGDALERPDDASAIVAETQAHIDATLAAAPDGWADRTMSVVMGVRSFGGVFLPDPGSESTQFFDDAGFDLNPGFPGVGYTQLSEEQYELLEADLLTVVNFDLDTVDWTNGLSTDPLLSNLDVVQRGDTVVFDDGMLMVMAGPIGAQQAIDQLVELVPSP